MSELVENRMWHKRVFRYVPFILWIGFIIFMSSNSGSMSSTSRFIRPLLEFLFPNALPETLDFYHGYVRKFAHITEYAILAGFASRAFWSSSKLYLQRFWYFFAMLAVFTVASIDEYNQSFNQSRTGSIYDVLLDCFGGFLMISAVTLWFAAKNRFSDGSDARKNY
jgi:VanZ family protein